MTYEPATPMPAIGLQQITPAKPMNVPTDDMLLNELAAALAKAQGAMNNASMNRINPHFKSKYADLAALWDAVRKPLSDNGLSVVQIIRDGSLHTMLLHTSGQRLCSDYPLPATARPQEMGSALTYARRYSLSALVGIAADEDDDANAASRSNGKPTEKLSEDAISELHEAIYAGGRTEDWFCKFAHIAELEGLAPERYDAALAYVKKLPKVAT